MIAWCEFNRKCIKPWKMAQPRLKADKRYLRNQMKVRRHPSQKWLSLKLIHTCFLFQKILEMLTKWWKWEILLGLTSTMITGCLFQRRLTRRQRKACWQIIESLYSVERLVMTNHWTSTKPTLNGVLKPSNITLLKETKNLKFLKQMSVSQFRMTLRWGLLK